MRKDVTLTTTIDPHAARLLATLAERETEGNRSQFLRVVIREAAERRGLTLADSRPAEVNLGEVRHAS